MIRFLITCFVPAALLAQQVPNQYIVELSEAPRASRRATQQRMVQTFGAQHRVRAQVETVSNALIVETSAPDALRATPGVRRVTPVFEVHANLDRAIPSHHINAAWELLPDPSSAGAGIKIGIIDTGLNQNHPAFAAGEMTVPGGFPKVSDEAFWGATSGKVIVQRSYDGLNGTAVSITDNAGHGTAVAMAAAGRRVKSQYGEISGVAPGAWIGVYRVFGGPTGARSSTATLLKAIDDAVADGMDVINLSLGFSPPIREGIDPVADAIQRAVGMGVMVVKAAGNDGPDRATVDSPSVSGYGISVGAIVNDRLLGAGVMIEGIANTFAMVSNGPSPLEPVRGKLVDVAGFDPTGLACTALPSGSLQGVVALILRGSCNFSVKLKNAQAAGALGAIVYTHALDPNPFTMAVEDALLPALMVGFESGTALKQLLVDAPETLVTITFTSTVPFELRSPPLSNFSSRGPTMEGRITPDVVAVGQALVTAAGTAEPRGAVYNASGFIVAQGTSFSSPMVAGAYAVLKQSRPGLTPAQYRSLLINGAVPFAAESDTQLVGAGKMDLLNSVKAPLTLEPATLNFGVGGVGGPSPMNVSLTHIGAEAGRYTVEVESKAGFVPVVEPAEFDLAPGASASVRVSLNGEFAAGEYSGNLIVKGPEGQVVMRAPYWYAVPRNVAANVVFLPYPQETATADSNVTLWFLTTDVAGVAATAEEITITPEEGAGSVVSITRREAYGPGLVEAHVKMGVRRGVENIFLVKCGNAEARAYIVSQ